MGAEENEKCIVEVVCEGQRSIDVAEDNFV
jgi:hypothetical protein